MSGEYVSANKEGLIEKQATKAQNDTRNIFFFIIFDVLGLYLI